MPAIVAFVIYLMYGKDKMRPDDGGNGTRSGKITPTASPGFLEKSQPAAETRPIEETRPFDGDDSRSDALPQDRRPASQETYTEKQQIEKEQAERENSVAQPPPPAPVAPEPKSESTPAPPVQDQSPVEERTSDPDRLPGSGLFRESNNSNPPVSGDRREDDKPRE